MPSGWSRPAVARPPSSAARHALPTVPYSADEQVPMMGQMHRMCIVCTIAKKYFNIFNTPAVSCEDSSGCSNQPKAPDAVG